MLACYLVWHLRDAWAPLTFTDEHPQRGRTLWPPHDVHPPPRPKPPAKPTPTTSPSAASATCSTTSLRSPATPSPSAAAPSTSSPPPRHSSAAPSTCSTPPAQSPSRRHHRRRLKTTNPLDNRGFTHPTPRNFGLEALAVRQPPAQPLATAGRRWSC